MEPCTGGKAIRIAFVDLPPLLEEVFLGKLQRLGASLRRYAPQDETVDEVDAFLVGVEQGRDSAKLPEILRRHPQAAAFQLDVGDGACVLVQLRPDRSFIGQPSPSELATLLTTTQPAWR